jgi:hypothetical protein
MVGIGSSSSSTPRTGETTSAKEIAAVFGGLTVGVGVLLLGVVGIIVSLPEPKSSSSVIGFQEMLTSEQGARAARERLRKDNYQQSIGEIERVRQRSMGNMVTSDQASQEARARLIKSGYYASAEDIKYHLFKDPVCEDERSFLIELLTDSQLDEFMEYLERDEEDGEYYRAETLQKDSCCCGATAEDPCVCMIEGVMDCSAVEPKCPCYEAKESFAYESEELIPIGTKVRSYDFWPHDKTCYKEGVIVDHAPSPSCSPGCMHYHIRTTKVVRRGKSRPVEEGEIFMTHPYADPWDQEYPGQLAPHIQSISTAFPSTSTI